ncbi:MAG: hypothetical protein AW09_002797 [Candidatus Accumulibacter phosphatis]|uniref:Uncharacterized protein n=1 Tax=Candidatus Accumulibacter phosphatis TaxID=327160 RepID=A0A080LTZ4_9PROT|nr:MAG: hypothetical protein AW09_002797 [Candidatus Accumulibacter phosphatis]
MRIDLVEQACCFEVGDDLLARCKAIHALVASRSVVVDLRVQGQDRDHRQSVALADRVVVEIVCGSDLDATGTKCEVHVGIGDDRDGALAERQPDHFSDQVPVTFVVGMDHHRGVAEHGFRARRGNGQRAAAIGQRITDVPEMAWFLFLHHLEVGDRGLQYRVPVDQALAAVDQALAVEADEGFGDRPRKAGVHREALAAPVRRGAEAAHLAGDGVAGELFPLPDFFEKFLASEFVP